MKRTSVFLRLQTEATRAAEDVVSGQITSTELPQAGERLPPVQDPPVVYENHLEEKRKGEIFIIKRTVKKW